MKAKLASLDSDFRMQHFALVNVLEEGTDLDKERKLLDDHDDRVSELSACIECLINHFSTSSPSTGSVLTDSRGVMSRCLRQLEQRLCTVSNTLSTDPCPLG